MHVVQKVLKLRRSEVASAAGLKNGFFGGVESQDDGPPPLNSLPLPCKAKIML